MVEKNKYNDKYRVIKPLGKGGQGEVYLVEDLHVNKCWAMKIVKGKSAANLEIQALKRFHHKYLPLIVDLIPVENDKIGIIMEYVEGETLEHYLQRKKVISQEQAVQWGIALAEVLQYLHTRTPGYRYGDMKPANIIIMKENEIKLIDLGTVMGENDTNQHYVVGTKGYMAPEKVYDSRSDIYSFGKTLHYMLTGNNPGIPGNGARPIREYNGTLSRGLEKIVMRCLEENPVNRYQTCQALIKDLKNYKILDEKYLWEYRVTCVTYGLLAISAMGIMGMELYKIAETGRSHVGYLLYSMICAAMAYLIKKIHLDRSRLPWRFYRQEISILKTEKENTCEINC